MSAERRQRVSHPFLGRLAGVVKEFFYIFLDISGILLGVFLTLTGLWITSGHAVSGQLGGVILTLGIAAFIIHTGHYFHLRITSWIFGSGTFFHKDEKRA